ncbi:MAG TPA: NAD(P)-binding domain-containing protein, partial [Burkholderiaceae bacterium]|nr:NAD(P)-binding domain-containing protein [Burkholderiaceae bacterium]
MKLGFIGGGNMAAALIGGLRRCANSDQEILVVERDPTRRDLLERDFGVTTCATIDNGLRGSTIVLLAVKPGDLQPVC